MKQEVVVVLKHEPKQTVVVVIEQEPIQEVLFVIFGNLIKGGGPLTKFPGNQKYYNLKY